MSQDNALISRPLIRPTPCSHLFKNYVLYDNFEDLIYDNRVGVAGCGFRYQDWTVGDGTWSAASGHLLKTAVDQTDNFIYIPQPRAYGTWEWKVKLSDVTNFHEIKTYFISSTANRATTDGYYLLVVNVAATGFQLNRVDAGAVTAIAVWANAPGVASHDIRVTRDAAGNFEVFVDGTSRMTVLDNTHKSSSYFLNNTYSTGCYIDDVKVYP